ncbi:hypothetical protein RIR_e47943_A0A2N1NH31_9GLOM [Rhizophagus irregularis DAOM 181602=DAOM 197198]|nr:hypothetical protein RIR_e47943_A0A2N1NH31_9GLOM [Rhizophagus irregularis DAOM 181602=DAOM 197198]
MFTKSCHSCHYTLYELRNACISLTFFLSPGHTKYDYMVVTPPRFFTH